MTSFRRVLSLAAAVSLLAGPAAPQSRGGNKKLQTRQLFVTVTDQDIRLGGKVAEEGGRRNFSAGSNLVDRRGLESSFLEEREGRILNGQPGLHLLAFT